MGPSDIYELCWADDPRIAPDGSTAAFVVWRVNRDSNDYSSAIWLVSLDGSGEPRRFSSGEKQNLAPRWSPDGSRLAFTSNREGKARQLYVIPVAGGESLRLTDLDEDVSEVAWSPDGAGLVFSARVRDAAYEEEDERKRKPRRFERLQYKLDNEGWIGDRRRHVFTVPADGSAPATQLTDGDYEDQYPAWSPDGRRIAFVSSHAEDWDVEPYRDVFVVDAGGGEAEQLTGGDGWHEAPSWSPDGSLIACRYSPGGFDSPRHGQIAVLQAATGERRLLTSSLDRNCAPYPEIREPVWDGDTLLFGVEDGGNNHLYRVPADGSGAPETVIGGETWVTGFDLAGGRIVHSATTPVSQGEVYEGERRLSDVTSSFAEAVELVEPERFTADLRRRHRGRRVGHEAPRVRGRPQLPGSAEHPRGPVHPVRKPVPRRVPGLCSGGLRRPLRQPARLLGLQRGVGPGDPRTGRRGPRLGDGRLRGPDGGRRRGAASGSTSATPTGSECSAAPTAAT